MYVNTFERLFSRYDEFVEDGEVVPTETRGMPLSSWEDLDEHKSKLGEIDFISAHPTRPSKQLKLDEISL